MGRCSPCVPRGPVFTAMFCAGGCLEGGAGVVIALAAAVNATMGLAMASETETGEAARRAGSSAAGSHAGRRSKWCIRRPPDGHAPGERRRNHARREDAEKLQTDELESQTAKASIPHRHLAGETPHHNGAGHALRRTRFLDSAMALRSWRLGGEFFAMICCLFVSWCLRGCDGGW